MWKWKASSRSGENMKAYLGIVGVLLLAGAAGAQPAPKVRSASLMKARVQFTVPTDWVEIRRNDHATAGALGYRIPNGPSSNPSANAAVVVREAKDETLAGYAASWIESSRVVHNAVVLNRFEDGNPVSDVFVLYRIEQGGVPYLAADRYSGRGNLLLQIRVAWPILPGASADWRRTALAASNRLLSDVMIDGKTIGALGILRDATGSTGSRPEQVVEAVRVEK